MKVIWKKIKLLILILIAGWELTSLLSAGKEPGSPPTALSKADKVLERIRRVQEEIKTARFQIYQIIEMNALSSRQVIKAEVKLKKPDKFYLRYTMPQKQFIASNGKKVWTYVPEYKQMTVSELKRGREYQKLVESIFFPFENLKEEYKVSLMKDGKNRKEQGYRIRLKPRTNGEELILYIDGETLLPFRIVSRTEETEVKTDIKEITINTEIPDKEFIIIPPEQTEIINLSGDNGE